MTPEERDELAEPVEPLSATDEALFPFVVAAEASSVATDGADAPTEKLVPPKLRDDFEKTLACLRQLERVRQDFGRQGASEPSPVAWDSVPIRSGQSSIANWSGQSPNLHVGRFDIVRELGRGGFAVVYLARDTRLRREVALKVPRPEALLSESMRERFAREARAAAALNHPGIVPVLEVGQHELECWIAYAYCDGPTLAQWLAARAAPVPARLAAELIAELADAVQHAHSRGILHRDIKPGNVLLEKLESRESRVERQDLTHAGHQLSTVNHQLHLRVRLTDFGLAKVYDEDESSRTRTGLVLGTVDYMAPEQADGRVKDIGVHTDVFALGAILYELLSGRPPFQGSSTSGTLRRVMHEEPLRLTEPSHHARVPRDLETICTKCLEKDFQRRYASAGALADDLRRFLAGEPIQARPARWLERAVKWMRRRPAAATAISLFTLLLFGLGALGWWHILQLRHFNSELGSSAERLKKESNAAKVQQQLAEKHAALIRRHAYAGDMRFVQQFVESGQTQVAIDVLNRFHPKSGEDDLRSFEWYYWWAQCPEKFFPFIGHSSHVYAVAYSPDGRRLLSGCEDKSARLWDVHTRKELLRLDHPHGVRCVAFSPDGQVCATGARDAVVRLWDANSGRLLFSLTDHSKDVRAIVYSRGGDLLITADQTGDIRVRDGKTGELRHRLRISPHVAHGGMVLCPDQKTLVVGEEWGYSLWRFDLSTKSKVPHESRFTGVVRNLCLSGSGERIFVGHDDGTMQVLNLLPEPGVEPAGHEPLPQQPPGFLSMACSPDDRGLVTIGKNGMGKLWQLSPLVGSDLPMKPGEGVLWAAFSPDSQSFAVGGSKGLLGILPHPLRNPTPAILGHATETWCVGFSPNGRWLASGSDDRTAAIWDTTTGAKRVSLIGHEATVSGVVFSPDGKTLATSSLDRTVKLWDVETGQLRQTLSGHSDRIRCIAFSHDGHWLASSGYDARVLLWNATTGELDKTLVGDNKRLRGVSFSRDGRTLAAGSESGNVLFWDTESGQPQPELDNGGEQVWSVCFTEDGHQLATGDEEGVVKLWDVQTRKPMFSHQAHSGGVRSVLITPDQKRIISAGEDRTVKIWDRETGQELTTLKGHQAAIYGLAITPDGRTLASCSDDGAIKVWHSSTNVVRSQQP